MRFWTQHSPDFAKLLRGAKHTLPISSRGAMECSLIHKVSRVIAEKSDHFR